MKHDNMLAMILAGGRGTRLHDLTKKVAKPAVSYGGKYRIIDFPLSNCANSGIDIVGVLTQYESVLLNSYAAAGRRWGLDAKDSGVYVLPPREKADANLDVYRGTADAISQNIDFIDTYSPDYLLILSGDHIYKMNYDKMLEYHKQNNADATIAVIEVPMKEASRFGIMNTDETGHIVEFEEKPEHPKSNLASMGIYIFTWSNLRKALIEDEKIHPDSDFGKHIIPKMLGEGQSLYAYRFKDYWKDVGTIESYWAANMELIKTLPEFNLYEDFWKIYTKSDYQPPQYTGENASIKTSIVSEGAQIYGSIEHCVISKNVTIEEGAVVKDSIIMEGCVIGKNAVLDRVIVDQNTVIGDNVKMGLWDNIPNEQKPKIYNTGITVIGSDTVVPDNIEIGKNCVVYGKTTAEDYSESKLPSGQSVIIEGAM